MSETIVGARPIGHSPMAARDARPPRVLADLWAGTRGHDVVAVLAGTAVLAAFAQVVIPLPFTPVPLSLATLGVLVTAAALGARRASASAGLYVVLGVMGLPVFADGHAGWAFASFGYVLGYVAAGALVGRLAERGADRRWWSAALIGAAGSAVVQVAGLAWMVVWLDLTLSEGLTLGVLPFLAGDALKVAVVAGVLPAAWRALDRS